jgi:AcrR family transcriptional regulator
MPPVRRDAAATRQKILACAVQEFARHGLAGARGDRIARAASSSERMVYYYFGSKQGLYQQALQKVYAQLRDAEQLLAWHQPSAWQALQDFCRFVWHYYAQHPEFVGLLAAENVLGGQNLYALKQLPELVGPVVNSLQALLDRGAAAGEFVAGLDGKHVYLMVAALGYFLVSNQHTLSAVMAQNVLQAPFYAQWQAQALQMVRGYCVGP